MSGRSLRRSLRSRTSADRRELRWWPGLRHPVVRPGCGPTAPACPGSRLPPGQANSLPAGGPAMLVLVEIPLESVQDVVGRRDPRFCRGLRGADRSVARAAQENHWTIAWFDARRDQVVDETV